MSKSNAVVAIYKSHAEAEVAVKELQHSGFDMKKLSIVGRDYHTDNTWSATTMPYCTGYRGNCSLLGGIWGCCSAPHSF